MVNLQCVTEKLLIKILRASSEIIGKRFVGFLIADFSARNKLISAPSIVMYTCPEGPVKALTLGCNAF